MSDADKRRLEEIARQHTVPLHEVRRARALLLAAAGANNVEIARQAGVTPRTVAAWRRQFAEDGLDAVRWTRRGRVPPQELPTEVVRLLLAGDGGPPRAHPVPPAVVEVAPRYPWLLRLTPGPDGPSVEWRPQTVAGAHDGPPAPALAVAHPGALRPAPPSARGGAPADGNFLAFLKAIDLRRPPSSEVHVVVNRQVSQLGAYDVDRWLSHPHRARIHLHLVPCPALWSALAQRWVAAGCAALAPRSVQRARPWPELWREQERQ